ncbi:MAG: trigger factor [Leptonema sp. (in: Bacteria)]|nr:trigger factor [Leptonema sp. (in: bacteria)]
MEYKVKKKSDTIAEISFTAGIEDIDQAYEKAYQNARAKVKVPGFRPGKAPMDVVKKQLGDSVIEDAANILIIDSYNKVIEEIEPAPVSRPSFKLSKFEPKKIAEFEAEYEYMPEVKVSKYKKIKIEQDIAEFDDSLYDVVIKRIQDQNVLMVPKEGQPVADGNVVTIDLQILLSSNKKELYKNSELEFDTKGSEVFPGLKEAILNRKADESDSYTIDVDNSFGDRRYAGKNVTVNFKIIDIKAKELPPVNDELASQAGDFKTLIELKEDIKKKILESADQYLKNKAVESLIQQVIEKNQLNLPNAVVESETERILVNLSRRLGIAEGQRISLEGLAEITGKSVDEVSQQYKDMAVENIKVQLFVEEIAKLESIEVADTDIDTEIVNRLNDAGQENEAMKEQLLKDSNFRHSLKHELITKKTLDWLYNNADVKKKDKVSCKTLVDERKIQI